jgi:hypothetical protein
MGSALGSQYEAMTVAAEILIAQLHSQSKLTYGLTRKSKKFDTKTNFLKQTNPLLMCRNVRSIE